MGLVLSKQAATLRLPGKRAHYEPLPRTYRRGLRRCAANWVQVSLMKVITPSRYSPAVMTLRVAVEVERRM
jgi:hypothetical protein